MILIRRFESGPRSQICEPPIVGGLMARSFVLGLPDRGHALIEHKNPIRTTEEAAYLSPRLIASGKSLKTAVNRNEPAAKLCRG